MKCAQFPHMGTRLFLCLFYSQATHRWWWVYIQRMAARQHGEANRDEMFFEIEEARSSQRFSFAPQPTSYALSRPCKSHTRQSLTSDVVGECLPGRSHPPL